MSSAPPNAAIRVLIVDNHLMVAQALGAFLEGHADLRVVGLAATVADALKLAPDVRPDVVLTELILPDGTGMVVTEAIRKVFPAAAVLFLTDHDTPGALLDAVDAGASGYLLKSESGTALLAALRRVVQGEMLVSPAVLHGLLVSITDRNRDAEDSARLLGRLTPREHEILGLMAMGQVTADVAESLGVDVSTVRTHVHHILEKLGVHSQLAAVTRAIQQGIVRL